MPIYVTLVPSPEHNLRSHPEQPGRFSYFGRLNGLSLARPLTWLDPTPASYKEAARVHDPRMLKFLQNACAQAPAYIDGAPTYVSSASWQAALNAAGGTLTALRAVLAPDGGRAFALVRPPGHHAEPGRAMGFCLLNNIAISALDALSRGVKRVAIVDFDAHHGNGTQAAFIKNDQVGFFSSHQEGIYPMTGFMEDAPQARGRLLNLPLSERAGDGVFEQIAGQVLHPWLEHFQPELLLVSAGYDAHWSDPLTSLGLSTTGYFHLTQRLLSLADEICQGRILFVLEGGYDPAGLADNVEATLRAMAGETTAPDPAGPSPYPEPDIADRLEWLRHLHSL